MSSLCIVNGLLKFAAAVTEVPIYFSSTESVRCWSFLIYYNG